MTGYPAGPLPNKTASLQRWRRGDNNNTHSSSHVDDYPTLPISVHEEWVLRGEIEQLMGQNWVKSHQSLTLAAFIRQFLRDYQVPQANSFLGANTQ